MSLRLKIVHTPGCFSLVDTSGTVSNQPETAITVIQTAFYDRNNETEKDRMRLQLVAFGNGVMEGYQLARRALQSSHFSGGVEELEQ